MRKITFIHAADLHLDSPFKGLTHLPAALFEEVRESTFLAFDTLIYKAILHQVDFILLTGDLFDHDVQSLKAQIHLRDGFRQLYQHHIQVFLSYGNHDYIHKDSQQVTFPNNVHVFQDEEVRSFIYEKNDEPVAEIHGFSYEKRAVTEEKIREFPVRDKQLPFHIGMLHGAVHGNTTHHAYAPFKLEQLKEKSYDYWALGHIHKRAVLQKMPPVVYPGNIQGRHRNETGEKGCYLVHMTEQETKASFMPLHHVQFMNLELEIAEVETLDDAEALLQQQLALLTDSPYLIHLTWTRAAPDHFGRQTENLLHELAEIINNKTETMDPWKYIYKTKVQFAEIEEQQVNALFMQEAEKAFREIDVQEEISELIQHPEARKFLELPSDETLLAEAKDTLLRKLLQRKEG